jgi:hypothetical protein
MAAAQTIKPIANQRYPRIVLFPFLRETRNPDGRSAMVPVAILKHTRGKRASSVINDVQEVRT